MVPHPRSPLKLYPNSMSTWGAGTGLEPRRERRLQSLGQVEAEPGVHSWEGATAFLNIGAKILSSEKEVTSMGIERKNEVLLSCVPTEPSMNSGPASSTAHVNNRAKVSWPGLFGVTCLGPRPHVLREPVSHTT